MTFPTRMLNCRSVIATTALTSCFIAAGALPSKAAGLFSCGNSCSYNLSDLITNNNRVQIKDKVFSNFSFSTASQGFVTPGSSNEITVLGSGQKDYDIRFQSFFSAFGSATNDVLLGFDVETMPGSNSLIRSVALDFNGNAAGTAVSEVIETIDDSSGRRLGTTVVRAAKLNGQSNGLDVPASEVILSQAVQKVNITKDIGLAGFNDQSIASASFIDQKFGTTMAPGAARQVPTPALLPGLVGMGAAALRKRKKAVDAE